MNPANHQQQAIFVLNPDLFRPPGMSLGTPSSTQQSENGIGDSQFENLDGISGTNSDDLVMKLNIVAEINPYQFADFSAERTAAWDEAAKRIFGDPQNISETKKARRRVEELVKRHLEKYEEKFELNQSGVEEPPIECERDQILQNLYHLRKNRKPKGLSKRAKKQENNAKRVKATYMGMSTGNSNEKVLSSEQPSTSSRTTPSECGDSPEASTSLEETVANMESVIGDPQLVQKPSRRMARKNRETFMSDMKDGLAGLKDQDAAELDFRKSDLEFRKEQASQEMDCKNKQLELEKKKHDDEMQARKEERELRARELKLQEEQLKLLSQQNANLLGLLQSSIPRL